MKDKNLYTLLKNATFKRLENSMDYKIEEKENPEITLSQVLALIVLFIICARNNEKIFSWLGELIK